MPAHFLSDTLSDEKSTKKIMDKNKQTPKIVENSICVMGLSIIVATVHIIRQRLFRGRGC